MSDNNIHDMSFSGIFQNADIVVQIVIVSLLLASVVSWAIIIARAWAILGERKKLAALAAKISDVGTVPALHQAVDGVDCGMTRVLLAVGDEWNWSAETSKSGYDQVRARILTVIDLAIAREAARVAGQTSWLATVGSISPFVGLFGTVWGIMASFIAIGQSQDTSLAVVAPGIAEALMATAIGLFCAIPAVIGYNRLLSGLASLDTGWRMVAGQLEVLISRQFQATA